MLSTILAAVDGGASASSAVGMLFMALLLVLGIIKCISISRRSTTSTLCVTSLTLALAAFLLPSAIRALAPAFPPSARLALAVLTGLTAILSAIAGLVLGIVGLVLYRNGRMHHGKSEPFTQGKGQAGWGIALNSLFILMFFGALVAGLTVRTRAMSVLQTRKDRVNLAYGEGYTFDDLNFRLNLAPENWVRMDPESIVQNSCLVLVRQFPQIYVSVIVEKLGVESGFTSDKLVEIMQSNLKAGNPTAQLNTAEPYTANGCDGRRFTADATLGALEFTYQYWCYATNGYAYQIVMWSAAKDRGAIGKYADQVFSSFEVLDPDRRCYLAGSSPFGTFVSGTFGYSIELGDSDWLSWENLAETDSIPEVGGHHPSDTWFNVTPIYLPVEGVSAEQIRQSLLTLYQISSESICSPSEPVNMAGLDGCTYAFIGNGYKYREYVLLGSNTAYLVSVWCPENRADQLREYANEVMSGFCLNVEAGPVDGMGLLLDKQLENQARMINQIGLTLYADGRQPEALEWFKAALSFDAGDPAYFANILAAYRQMGRSEEGLAFIDAHSDSPSLEANEVKSWQASMLIAVGRGEEANAMYEAMFASGYRDDEDFMAWTRLRAESGRWEDLDGIFADYFNKESTVDLRIHQMDLYWGKGDYQRVVDLAEASQEKYGFSPVIAYWVIDGYQQLGLYTEALAACEEMLKRNYTPVKVYHEKAESEYGLKWYRQAKESLEEALRLNPHNEDTQQWLQLVSAELGEGSNSVLKDAIDPVELPREVESLFRTEIPEGFGEDFGAYYERHLVLWDYTRGERLRRTNVQRIKLLDNAGVSSFSSLVFVFDPLCQNIFVNELLVRDERGEVVSRGVVKDYYVTDDSSDELISEDKQLVIPVPGLLPGYTIDVSITRDYPSAPEQFYFERVYLAAGYPVLNSGVWLSGAPDEVEAVVLNDVNIHALEGGRLWLGREPYSYRWEPLQSPVESFVPVVVLGSKGESWEAAAQEYLEKIKDRLGADERVRDQVKELTEGLESEEDRFAAIVDWVRSTFTYKPLEFGRSAYMPDCTADTLSYRYGDCKDLSLLVVEMLKAAGIDAHLALVNSSAKVYPEICTTDQFDHMIAYVPTIRGGMFVDPTDQDVNAFISVPYNLKEQRALVLDPDNVRLETLPAYPEGSSTCRIERNVTLEGNLLQLEDHIVLHGYCASWMRGLLKDQQKINWVQWFQQNVADFIPDLEVTDVSAIHVTDNAKDLILDINSTLRHAVRIGSSDELTIMVPSIWADYYLSARIVPDRQSPFVINYPFEITLMTDIQTPEGFELNAPVLAESQQSDAFLDLTLDAPDTGRGRFQAVLKTGEYPAADYAGYVASSDAAVKSARLEVTMKKVPAVAETLSSTNP